MADFAPGAYDVKYAGTSIGETEGPKRFQMTPLGEPIRQDSFGRVVVDVIDQGQDWFVQMILKEWNAAVEAALFPFGTYGAAPTVIAGRLYSALAAELTMTPTTGTPAKTLGPGNTQQIRIPIAHVMFDQQIEAVLGNVERNTPVTFICLPASDGKVWADEVTP